jgi:hypothetical protein
MTRLCCLQAAECRNLIQRITARESSAGLLVPAYPAA